MINSFLRQFTVTAISFLIIYLLLLTGSYFISKDGRLHGSRLFRFFFYLLVYFGGVVTFLFLGVITIAAIVSVYNILVTKIKKHGK